MSIGHAMEFFNNLKLAGQRAKIAEKILKEIGDRLKFLVNVGLNYVRAFRRRAIRLAKLADSGLVGVMYSNRLSACTSASLLGTLIHRRLP